MNAAVVTPAVVLTLCAAPKLAPPSLNCTVPVGGVPAPEPGAVTLTVAVKVTEAPNADELFDDVTAVVVFALFTTWLKLADVPPVKFVSPAYTAVIVCVATLSDDVLNVALVTPPLVETGPVNSSVAPSLNVTVPVGGVAAPDPGAVTVIVAVSVTD